MRWWAQFGLKKGAASREGVMAGLGPATHENTAESG